MKKVMMIVLGMLLPLSIFAAQQQDKAVALINKVTQGQATVVKEFDSIGNLKGFVMKPKQKGAPEVVVYADKVLELYYQNPKFGFLLIQLINKRLLQDEQKRNSVG